jgi:hypothetical protein
MAYDKCTVLKDLGMKKNTSKELAPEIKGKQSSEIRVLDK